MLLQQQQQRRSGKKRKDRMKLSLSQKLMVFFLGKTG
jgi:hypothetical protein